MTQAGFVIPKNGLDTLGLKNLGNVIDVKVELVPGGLSTVTVTSDAPLAREQVEAALDEVGDYQLAGN